MPIRFRPPRDVPDLGLTPGQQARFNAWLRSAFVEIAEDLAGLGLSDISTPIAQETIDVAEGSLRRVTPPSGGMAIRIPAPTPANIGSKIRIMIEAPVGALTIVCRPGVGDDGKIFQPTINGAVRATFTAAGLVELTSNGANDWKSTAEFPAESPAAAASIISQLSTLSINVSAGTRAENLTAITFSNSNNLSFGLQDSILTGSVTVASTQASIRVSAGTTSALSSAFTFSNSNNVSFGMNTNGVVTATATVASTQASIRVSAGTTSILSSAFTFSNSNNVSFGINTNGVVTATVTVVSTQASIRVSAGTTSVLSSAFTFSNSNNVSFGIDAAGVVTATATVASTQASIRISAGTTSALSSAFTFSNSNNVSFGINAAGVVTATATVASTQASILVSAGTTSALSSSFRFSNANAISFGMSTNGVITASAASGISAVGAGTLSVNQQLTGIQFQDSHNVSWTMSTNAGTPGNAFIHASATVAATREIGVVSHVGGNVVSSVSRLAFSNASNVTFSLSTAANAATLFASVNAGAGGGIAAADIYGNTLTSGTLLFQVTNPNSTISNLFSVNSRSNNVAFGITNGSQLTAQAHLAFFDATNGDGSVATRLNLVVGGPVTFNVFTGSDTAGARQMNVSAGIQVSNDSRLTANTSIAANPNVVFSTTASSLIATAWMRVADNLATSNTQGTFATKVQFDNSNGVTFGVGTFTNADGRVAQVTASYNPLAIAAPGSVGVSSGTVNITNWNSTLAGDARGNMKVNAEMSSGSISLHYDPPRFVGRWNGLLGGVAFGLSTFHNRPFLFQPFIGDPLEHFGAGDDCDIAVWKIGHTNANASVFTATSASSANSVAYAVTYKAAIYSLEGGTGSRLTLVNSASLSVSRAANWSSLSSAFHGSRWVAFPKTNWSNDSGLTGGNWWLALMCSQATSSDSRMGFNGNATLASTFGFGHVGLNAGAAGSRIHPFHGFFTTTTGAFPATIASSHLFTTASGALAPAAWMPAVSLQIDGNAAFG